MRERKRVYDVFLSHTMRDGHIAQHVKAEFVGAGLTVFSYADLKHGARFVDAIREELAASGAFVVILTRAAVRSQNIAIECGAALAWQKAFYALRHHVQAHEIPGYLSNVATYKLSNLGEVVDAIRRASEALSPSEKEALSHAYLEVGVPSDKLAVEPAALDNLTRRFNRASKGSYAAERVLQELIRLRKQNRLPRLKR